MAPISPHFSYYIEVRDKSALLLEAEKREIGELVWAYETVGGYTDCTIVFNREFDNFQDLDLDYDIRIRRYPTTLFKEGDRATALGWPIPIKLAGGQGVHELRYRGFIRSIKPIFDETESVRLGVSGYVRQLEYIHIPNQTYASQDVGAAARSIIDTYVVGATQIKRTDSLGLVQDQGVVLSSTGLTFDGSAYEALRTLADIGGNAEWGVRTGLNAASPEDNEIFFLARSAAVKQVWGIGGRIEYFESEKNTDEVVRKVFIKGNAITGNATSPLGLEAGRSKERGLLLPFIATAADLTLWATAFFSRFDTPPERGRLRVSATDAWIENFTGQTMPPIGLLRVIGGAQFRRAGAELPAQFDASGNIALLETLGGTTYKEFRPSRIVYKPVSNALQIEIELGEKRSALDDLIRGIEFKLNELRQAV